MDPSRDIARLQAENQALRAELQRCECRVAGYFHQNAAIDDAIRRERDRFEHESKRVLRFNSHHVLSRLDALLRVLQ